MNFVKFGNGKSPFFKARVLAPLYNYRSLTTPKVDPRTPTLSTDYYEKGNQFKRPLSPHMTIYEPQLTWVMSIANRSTAVGLVAAVYGFSMWYAIAPFESSPLISAIHSTNPELMTILKFAIASPFWYHSFNGIRHMVWDVGSGLSLKAVYVSGYITLAATTVGTVLSVL